MDPFEIVVNVIGGLLVKRSFESEKSSNVDIRLPYLVTTIQPMRKMMKIIRHGKSVQGRLDLTEICLR